MPMRHIADSLNIREAERIAAAIRNFWIAKGYRGIATTLVEVRDKAGNVAGYGVRTNLINGVPPRTLKTPKTAPALVPDKVPGRAVA